jgi:tripartite-type tricarboxylate transporter receptor subunit TctC
VARAGADGHTMGSGNSTNIVMNRSVQVKLPYDPDTDLRAVIQTHFQPNLLAVHPALPAKTVRELIDYAQRNPGKLLYASSGNGSSLHFAAELFKLMSGASMDHVPYASIPVGVNDLMAGRVHVIFDNMSSIAPHVKSGRVRGLGVTSAKRSPVFPELPTIAESGLPGYEIVAWSGLVVPAGTPGRIVDKLNAAAARALAAAAVREKLQALGLEIVGGTPEQFARLIRSETAKWAEVAKRTGIRPE